MEDTFPQSEVFSRFVAPALKEGKTAYLMVDALRYEMAHELLDGLGDDLECSLSPILGQLPGVTDVGMSALLPGAEKGMELVSSKGRVLVHVDGKPMKSRADRLNHLKSAGGAEVIDLKLNDLMKPRKSLQNQIAQAELIVVTSQELDRRGEEAEDEEATRRFMEDVLEKLRRGIRRLAQLGVTRVIVVADHGHLFDEALHSGLKVNPPGGQTLELHRRVWIGRGGKTGAGFIRVSADDIGLGGDLELAFPRGLGCFKVPGGGGAYFHGGTSLQEILIPVVSIRVRQPAARVAAASRVDLHMEKRKIATRFFSVTATYKGGDLFAEGEKRVSVDVRSRNRSVGQAATAAYGFHEGSRQIDLRKDEPNAITFMLTEESPLREVSVLVLDAVTQVGLARLENIPVDISV